MSQQDLLRILETGFRHQKAGDAAQAETAYRKVLDRDPDNIHALNLLGVLLVNSGRSTEATPLLIRAASVVPDDDETQANLGLALKDAGELARAASAFERAVELNPTSPAHLNHLANAKFDLGDTSIAIELYRRAVTRAPNYPEALSNLARALNHGGHVHAALPAAKRAVRIAPTVRNWTVLGDVLVKCCDYGLAVEAYDRALALDPVDVEALINKSIAHKEAGRRSAAESCLDAAEQAEPDSARIAFARGLMLEQAGDTESASNWFRRALALQPDFTAAAYQLAQLKSPLPETSGRPVLQDILMDEHAPRDKRRHAAFALARLSETAEDYPGSLGYYDTGHALILGNARYDPNLTERLHSSIRETSFVRPPENAEPLPGPIPIFVIGMPRSGTSLSEQILASHPLIAGAGESSFLEDCVNSASRITRIPYPDFMPALTRPVLEELASGYRRRLSEGHNEAAYVVDKTPMNFQYVAFAAAMLPDARFIYCNRNPVDNCLSIYRHPFDAHQTYAHSLDALRHFYASHRKLMEFWIERFPNRILTVSYEQVVEDLQGQAKAMLDHIGLPFDPAVLDFHQTERIVRTPSAGQVRRPIYRDSLEYWRRYGSQLATLESLLEARP